MTQDKVMESVDIPENTDSKTSGLGKCQTTWSARLKQLYFTIQEIKHPRVIVTL
jgi:hypothetical protein